MSKKKRKNSHSIFKTISHSILGSRFGSGGSPRIKSKEIVSQDMTDLCVRVAETAISDDFDDLDGMSFSLSGKGKRM